MGSRMDEKETDLVKPVVSRQEGWKEQTQKRHFTTSSHGSEKQEEEDSSHKPAPLPFGKIDLLA